MTIMAHSHYASEVSAAYATDRLEHHPHCIYKVMSPSNGRCALRNGPGRILAEYIRATQIAVSLEGLVPFTDGSITITITSRSAGGTKFNAPLPCERRLAHLGQHHYHELRKINTFDGGYIMLKELVSLKLTPAFR